MTYRAGIGLGMAKLGIRPDDPHVRCDDCGAREGATNRHGGPKRWLLDGKAPRGWLLYRYEDNETGEVLRRDYCKACREKHSRDEFNTLCGARTEAKR